ncbi:MAG: hypothetical protein KAT32_04635 [Candidatus Moranbacteria bacterium]|nr:hypothetical protein [Candidatus Moranbacteria bacterium]
MKKIAFIFVFSCLLLSVNSVLACDPLGCLFGGYKQDILILGEVESEKGDDIYMVETHYIFPQTKGSFAEDVKENFSIRKEKLDEHISVGNDDLNIGNKYLMSLVKVEDKYICKWGCFEIDDIVYSKAKLLEKDSLDDEALEIFINSGGKEINFSFDYGDYNKEVLTVNGGKSDERKIIRYSFYEKGKNIVINNLILRISFLFFIILIFIFYFFKIKKISK